MIFPIQALSYADPTEQGVCRPGAGDQGFPVRNSNKPMIFIGSHEKVSLNPDLLGSNIGA